jgi:hypothetical protein
VLQTAFCEIQRLPVFPLAADIGVIADAARNQKRAVLVWPRWRYVPVAACVLALAIVAGVFYHPSSSTVAKRPDVMPIRKDVTDPVRLHQDHAVVLPLTIAKAGHDAPTLRHDHNIRAVGPAEERRTSRHDTTRRAPEPARTPASEGTVAQRPSPPAAAETVIAQYVDTLAQCMTKSDTPRATVSCAIQPVAANGADLPMADTLTAALVDAFTTRYVTMEITRLAPDCVAVDPHASQPLLADAARLRETVSADYVIVSSLTKAKAGYLLSLYAVNRCDDTVVFDGGHPILLPEGWFTTPGAAAHRDATPTAYSGPLETLNTLQRGERLSG